MYLPDTNALIILLYGDVADGKLTESSLDILQCTPKRQVGGSNPLVDAKIRKAGENTPASL